MNQLFHACQFFSVQITHSQNALPADEMSDQVPAEQVEDAQNTPNTQMVSTHCTHTMSGVPVPSVVPFSIHYTCRLLALQLHSPLKPVERSRAAMTVLVSGASLGHTCACYTRANTIVHTHYTDTGP